MRFFRPDMIDGHGPAFREAVQVVAKIEEETLNGLGRGRGKAFKDELGPVMSERLAHPTEDRVLITLHI